MWEVARTGAERSALWQRAKRCGRMSAFGTSVRIARSVARMMRERRGSSVTDTQRKTDRVHEAQITGLAVNDQSDSGLLIEPYRRELFLHWHRLLGSWIDAG